MIVLVSGDELGGAVGQQELSLVADEHQSAISTRIDELHKVVEQTARAEHRLAQAFVGYHRRLVDEKQRVGHHVWGKRERTAERLLAVDAAVDGGSLYA